MTKTFNISPGLLGKVQATVDRLNRRAAKLQVAPVVLEVGPVALVPNESGVVVRMHPVTVSLEVPKLPDWRFLATLEHTEAGNIIRTMPGVEGLDLSPYRTCGPKCEHCNIDRNRHDTFVVEHATDGRKQVGRDCLADFLGLGKSAGDAAAWAEYLSQVADLSAWITDPSARDSDFDGSSECGRGDGVGTLNFLAYVADCAKRHGFRTGKQARETMTTSTAEEAISRMFPGKGKVCIPPSAEADYEAAAALLWAQAIEVKSDFDHNLKVIASAEYITFRDCGIAAYIIQAHRRAQEQVIERAARPVSKHFGTPGVRVKKATLVYKGSASFDSAYGITYIHRFVTPEGDQAIWKTGNGINNDIGTAFQADYTIKEHGEWKGNLQTVLTRVKII